MWQFSEDFGIQWYGLSFMLSFVFAYIFLRWMVFRQRSELQAAQVGDFVLVCLAGALLGGRLGYCLFYSADLFIKFKAEFPYWGVFAINEGGMSSYGGLIGILIAATAFALRLGISRLYLYDLIAITAPMGIFFGRLANFINGELIGKEAPGNIPFSVKFPTEILQWTEHSPEKLAQLSSLSSQVNGATPESWAANLANIASDENAKNAINDFLISVVKLVQNKNVEVTQALAPFLLNRHPVQIYAALAEGAFLFFFLFIFWFRPRKSGVVAATGLVLYSVIYFILENFRETDFNSASESMGLSRGQVLSMIAFALGLLLMFLWGRRETLSVSGWGRGHSVKLHRR
jgi:phosphatidylglycerol:prolipoprotein diacylglycerol transferase